MKKKQPKMINPYPFCPTPSPHHTVYVQPPDPSPHQKLCD